MGETLFIAHRMPCPPDRGDKIRSYHVLKALAAMGPVHVATLGETTADFAAEPLRGPGAASPALFRRPGLPFAGLRALANRRAISLQAFDSRALHAWIARTLAQRPVDTVFVFSAQMGQYVPHDFAGRVVIDLCDVDSAKFEAYAREHGALRGWIHAREAHLLAAEETRLVARANATLLVSEPEAALLRARVGGDRGDILAVGNGVDTGFFDPATVAPHPALVAEPGPHLVFTGQMDYPPNVAAARRAAHALMPAIRAVHPQARFHVVGRAPGAEVRALDGVHGTKVWGEVPDVRPFLGAADLVAAPLAIARGVQNKVLEAMAMARPVLVTPEAAQGIGGSDGTHYAVAGDDSALVERALTLLSAGPQAFAMAAAARRFVVAEKSWEAALRPLANLVGRAADKRDAA